MKAVTNNFKEQIAKLGREIDFKIFLHTNDKIITEDGKFLMTEDNLHLVVEQFDEEEIDETITRSDIYNVAIVSKGNILSTMMKEVDFEVKQDLRVGDVIGCQFGLKVGQEYEYVDYGKYIIYSKEFNEDTRSYDYVAFDRMLLTMQEANQDFLASLEGETLASCINLICDKVGLSFNATQEELAEYPNLSKEINEGTFTDMEMTYRDLLDMIAQALGLSMVVNGSYLILKPLNRQAVDTIDEHYLKDTNVKFGEKYMINSIVLSRSEDTDNIYRRDEESVADYGVHEFKIKDNLIMLYDDREDYIDEIFEQLNGVEFYINDFSSTGITYLDWLDFYNVSIGDKTYKCLMLNDEIKIQQGVEETVYTEEPEETVTDYKTSSKTDKEVSFIVDKQNARIKGSVQKDNIIASLNLAIEDEQGIVELKGNSVIIESDNFNLDANGNATMRGGNIYLTEGSQILGDDGLKSTILILSNICSQRFVGGSTLLPMGFSAVGQDQYGNAIVKKDWLSIEFEIPEDFVITSAKIILSHSPVNYTGFTSATGYSRNLKLFKSSNGLSQPITLNDEYYVFENSDAGYSEIAGAFGSNGFTGNSYSGSSATSIELKDYISTGFNKFKIQSMAGTPSTYQQCYQYSGACMATLYITGYTNFEEI